MVMIIDWHASHFDPKVKHALERRGHTLLMLGGGTTGVVQVPDTHLHQSFSQLMNKLEEDTNYADLALRDKLHSKTKVQKLHDTEDVWAQLDHAASATGHTANGITNALNGKYDLRLSSDVLRWWQELNMHSLCRQLIIEVKCSIDDGTLKTWADYDKLIEPYDNHKGIR